MRRCRRCVTVINQSQLNRDFIRHLRLYAILHSAVATPHVDVIALLGSRADASHVGGVGRRAALRLGLVVTKDEERIGAGLELGPQHRLIGVRVAPRADPVVRDDADIVERPDGLVGLSVGSRILQEITHEPLRRTPQRHCVDHDQVRNQ